MEQTTGEVIVVSFPVLSERVHYLTLLKDFLKPGL